MKYQIGDDIIVLLSNEEGKVVEIMNDKMVMIDIRGVKFPAYMDQIDFPYFYRFTKKKLVEEKKPKLYVDNIPKEKPQPNVIKVSEGVWLALIPKFTMDDFNDEIVDSLKVHLINKTEKSYKFTYDQQFLGQSNFSLQNEVMAFHDFYLHDIKFEDVNDSPSFSFDFSLVNIEKNKAQHFETILKIKPKQLFQRIEEMKDKNEPTVSYKLFDNYPDKVFEEDNRFELSSLAAKGYKVYQANQIRQNLEPARSVVDLHIEKLSNSWEHLSNFEILTIQLKEFEKWFDLSVAHIQPSLIVIHGVGTGKLKDEIHEILKTKKQVRYFVNQYDARFGYGATELFFQY